MAEDDVTATSNEDLVVGELGAAVRAARKRLSFSVQTLAQRAGVSFGLISQLERGLGNPSLHSLSRIAAALGVPVSQLLDSPAEDFVVVPANRRHVLPPAPDAPEQVQAARELLSPRSESAIQLIRTVLPSGFSNEDRPFRHLGTETVTVLTGRLIVAHGMRQVTLEEGDCATYVCSAPHWWANGYDGETILLGAVTPFEH